MSTAHTPGPWRSGDRWKTIFAPNDGQPSPPVIATIHCPDAKFETIKANAHLIAAAPELLAALQSLLEWNQNVFPTYATDDVPVIQSAQAAISKATK